MGELTCKRQGTLDSANGVAVYRCSVIGPSGSRHKWIVPGFWLACERFHGGMRFPSSGADAWQCNFWVTWVNVCLTF